ncbi:hypothetical protein HZB94_02800 [Candidatus Falkowbacteria bacterium]|nr:hypothetical protein [Candidatus Falkowbacteria bacterium]
MSFKYFLYFCIFAIPFLPQGTGFYFGHGVPTLDLPRILMILLIFSWLIKKAVHGECFHLYKGNITNFLLLLIIAQFISIFAADKLIQSTVVWIGYLLYYYVIFFILSDQIKTDEEWRKIFKTITFLGVGMAIVAIIEFILQRGIYDQFRFAWLANPSLNLNFELWRIEGLMVSKGPYGGSQSFGFFFSIIFFLVLYDFLREKKKSAKVYKLMETIMVALALLTTQVRAAIIAVSVSFVISLFLQKLSRQQIKNILLSSTIILVSIIIINRAVPAGFWQYTFSESVTKIQREQSTFFKRVDGLKITLEDIAKKPILGYGTGAVVKHMSQISKFELRSDLPLAIAFYIESGVFGFLAFLGLIYSLLVSLWRFHEKHKTEMLPYYLLLSFLSYIISTSSAPQLESSFIFFVLLAYAAFLTKKKTINISII